MPGVDQRGALMALAGQRGYSLAALSVMLRRNPAYLQQFVQRGTPRELAERDRRLLADVLGVGEAALGGRAEPFAFRLPRLDVAASAGPGALVDAELLLGTETLAPELATALGLREGRAGMIRVRGDSMEPALRHGDHLVVDTVDRRPGSRARIYVVRIDGALLVKRVVRGKGGLMVTSDNPASPPVPDGPVEVIGRVVWRMGRPD